MSSNVYFDARRSLRVATAPSPLPEYGDHVSIEFMREDTPGQWHFALLSPDDADRLADDLKRRADSARGK